MWMMRPGLDGAADTVSFEAVARPGWFVTAAGPEQQTAEAAACHDAPGDQCHDRGEGGPCARDACEWSWEHVQITVGGAHMRPGVSGPTDQPYVRVSGARERLYRAA